jgi:hypothetical protein
MEPRQDFPPLHRSESPAGATIDDDELPAASGFPLVSLAGVVLACFVLAGLWWRAEADRPPRPAAATVRASDAAGAIQIAAEPPSTPRPFRGRLRTSPPTLIFPDVQDGQDRESIAGLHEARQRFGGAFVVRHPAYLPADVAPFAMTWQPHRDPDRRARGDGELITWFYSAEHGAVLLLAQGPGVGVLPLTAGPDRAGRLSLADGSEVIWVIGHPVRVAAAPPSELEWSGTEITIGVRATSGDGWYLSSPILSLPELMRIADSLGDAGADQ